MATCPVRTAISATMAMGLMTAFSFSLMRTLGDSSDNSKTCFQPTALPSLHIHTRDQNWVCSSWLWPQSRCGCCENFRYVYCFTPLSLLFTPSVIEEQEDIRKLGNYTVGPAAEDLCRTPTRFIGLAYWYYTSQSQTITDLNKCQSAQNRECK